MPVDLIELDSREASFEVDDFDPLNQNAKQIPAVPKRTPVVLPTVPSSVPKSAPPNHANPGFSNPMYPYFIPSYLQQSANAAQPPASNPMNNTTKIDDDVELLRKYGLDRFKLIDRNSRTSTQSNDTAANRLAVISGGSLLNQHTNRTSDPFLDNGLQTNGDIHRPKSNNNWTTFDWMANTHVFFFFGFFPLIDPIHWNRNFSVFVLLWFFNWEIKKRTVS